jgi:hypothetical protein
LRWPDGFRCPQCGGRASWRLNNARFECRACGRQTSATAGTIFEGTRKPLRLWLRAIECVTGRRQGASALVLQGLLRLPSYQTAWVWLHKLRRAMAREDPLHGAVEVGTAELWSSGEFGEEERGMIIIGAEVDGTRIGRVRMQPVRNALPRYLHAFVEQCVVSGSTIRTDGWHGYVGLAQKGYLHEALPYWRNWDLEEDLRGRPKANASKGSDRSQHSFRPKKRTGFGPHLCPQIPGVSKDLGGMSGVLRLHLPGVHEGKQCRTEEDDRSMPTRG